MPSSKRSNRSSPRKPRAAPASSSYATSGEEEDAVSAFQVPPRPTKKPLAPASGQESDGDDEVASSDEIGENGVLVKRQQPPRKKKNVASQLKKRKGDQDQSRQPKKKKKTTTKGKTAAAEAADELARSRSPEKDTTAAASGDAGTPTAPPSGPADETSPRKTKTKTKTKTKGKAAEESDDLARSRSPEKDTTAAASDFAGTPTPPPSGPADETSRLKKKKKKKTNAAATTEAAGSPPPTEGPADAATTCARPVTQKKDAYDAEKHLREKSETYWHLWRMVLALEKEHCLSYREAFLKMRDSRASTLNAKIKSLCLWEIKLQMWRKDNRMEVAKAMLKFIR